jgi:zinc transport system substrate-binding protein
LTGLLNAGIINSVVSVLPQKMFVEIIGGDKVSVSLMVKPGNSPHTYEPKPSQMKDISKANLYFSIGVEFEKVWLKRFSNQNKEMKIVDIGMGVKRINKDPHIWVSPLNVKIIVNNIYKSLVKADNKNRNYYKKNLDNYLLFIETANIKIKNILKDTPKGTKFMVFHPAWGYFARDYNLIQIPIEVDGKSPKPKGLKKLIDTARDLKVSAIFTQPEFSPKVANQIAKELNIKVIKATPLALNWEQNLINLSKAIALNGK